MELMSGFWKSQTRDIKEAVRNIKKGKSRILGHSAGGREIYCIEYGEKPDHKRQANYSSACGAGNPAYYAQKGEGTPPVILLVGGTHGGEMEGIVGILNLMNILETGRDFRGKLWDYLYKNWQNFRIIIIPCINPDGRDRVPFDSFIGQGFENLRYYVQGTWKDGTLCGWPDCKAIHPILGHVDQLGGYFNDEGINLMHDNFFLPMAQETKMLMKLVDEEAPDCTVLLHGGTNCTNGFTHLAYAPEFIQQKIRELDSSLEKRCIAAGLPYQRIRNIDRKAGAYPPSSFNLASAIHHICGGISLVYESNQGLDAPGTVLTAEEILDSHLLLFEEVLCYNVLRK